MMDSKVKIVVLQRGWVVVGKYEKQGEYGVLSNGAVIRLWGTSQGLPQLAQGPLKETKLDKTEFPMRFHELTVVMTIDCEDSKWIKALE